MPDPHDPLRDLFKEAAGAGQSRARSAPVAAIAARGRARQLWRAVGAATACLVLAGLGVTAAELLSGGASGATPASTSPVGPWPTRSPQGASPTAGSTGPPSGPDTSSTGATAAGHGAPTRPGTPDRHGTQGGPGFATTPGGTAGAPLSTTQGSATTTSPPGG